MECHSKKDALDTLAKTIAKSDSATSQVEVFDCLLARERLGSTGLGKGIAIPQDPQELARIIFLPAFSTAAEVSDLSGRGVGLACAKHV